MTGFSAEPFSDAITAADALLFVTPDYHCSATNGVIRIKHAAPHRCTRELPNQLNAAFEAQASACSVAVRLELVSTSSELT